MGASDVGVDAPNEFGDGQGRCGPVAAQEVGFELVVQELGAPVPRVVVLAAVGVIEDEAVLGDVMVGAGGKPPPEAGAVAVTPEVEQAREDEGAGFVGVLAGDEGGELAVGVGAEQGQEADGVEVPPGAIGVRGAVGVGRRGGGTQCCAIRMRRWRGARWFTTWTAGQPSC